MAFLCLILAILASCIYAVILYERAMSLYRLDGAVAEPNFLAKTKRLIWIGIITISGLCLGAIIPGLANGINDFGEQIIIFGTLAWMFSVILSSSLYMLRLQKIAQRQDRLRSGATPPPPEHRQSRETAWRIIILILGGTILFIAAHIIF